MRLPCLFAGHGGASAGSTTLLGRQGAELVLDAVEHEVDAAVNAELAVNGGEMVAQDVLARCRKAATTLFGEPLWRTTAATTLRSAAVNVERQDVVLLDLDLGEESELDFVSKICGDSQVLILTGSRDADVHQDRFHIAFTRYVTARMSLVMHKDRCMRPACPPSLKYGRDGKKSVGLAESRTVKSLSGDLYYVG